MVLFFPSRDFELFVIKTITLRNLSFTLCFMDKSCSIMINIKCQSLSNNFYLLYFSVYLQGGYAMGASAGRRLGNTPEWLYERERIPTVPSL